MTVRANKPEFNIREKLKELESVSYEKMPAGSIIQVKQSSFNTHANFNNS